MPELPEGCTKAWDAFLDLHLTRRSGLNGPERLGFSDLRDWQIVTGSNLQTWEIKAIFAVDQAFMASVAREQAKQKPGG